MITILAAVGLVAVFLGGLSIGWIVGNTLTERSNQPVLNSPLTISGRRHGLIIYQIEQARRIIYVCADRSTSFRLKTYGRVCLEYRKENGDLYWSIHVSDLADFNLIVAEIWDLAYSLNPDQYHPIHNQLVSRS